MWLRGPKSIERLSNQVYRGESLPMRYTLVMKQPLLLARAGHALTAESTINGCVPLRACSNCA